VRGGSVFVDSKESGGSGGRRIGLGALLAVFRLGSMSPRRPVVKVGNWGSGVHRCERSKGKCGGRGGGLIIWGCKDPCSVGIRGLERGWFMKRGETRG